MNNYSISIPEKSDFQEITEVWEASVKATHHFLTEEDIEFFKPLILNQYLDAVELRIAKNPENKIIGFLGVADGNLEMLFIHPDYMGKGLGKQLLKISIENLKVSKVDVNEDNPKALEFYLHHGFEIVGRDATDPHGKPFPILHLQLPTH